MGKSVDFFYNLCVVFYTPCLFFYMPLAAGGALCCKFYLWLFEQLAAWCRLWAGKAKFVFIVWVEVCGLLCVEAQTFEFVVEGLTVNAQ